MEYSSQEVEMKEEVKEKKEFKPTVLCTRTDTTSFIYSMDSFCSYCSRFFIQYIRMQFMQLFAKEKWEISLPVKGSTLVLYSD